MRQPNQTQVAFDEYAEAEKNLKPLYQDLNQFELLELVTLMQEPVKAIHSCISKGQLQTLCKQLLAQNLVLQQKLSRLKNV